MNTHTEETHATPTVLYAYHGSQRWQGPVEIRHRNAESRQGGPGFYMTTNVQRAREYSKGAGKTLLISFDPPKEWLEDARRPLNVLLKALNDLPRVKKRDAIEKDLKEAQERHPGQDIYVSYLVNLMVNYGAQGGKTGTALAEWLAKEGIGAGISREGRSYGSQYEENFVVLFDPTLVRKVKPLTVEEAYGMGDLPPIPDQLKHPLDAPSAPQAPPQAIRKRIFSK